MVILLEDRILLFDYKTDHYKVPSQLVERYRDQLDLMQKLFVVLMAKSK